MRIYKIERKAGLFDGVKKLFEPEQTNPYIPKADPDMDDNGKYVIDPGKLGVEPLKKPDEVDANEVASMFGEFHTSDPDLMMAAHRAIAYIKENPAEKAAQGLKVALYYILSKSNRPEVPKFQYVVKQWYKEIGQPQAVSAY